MAGWEAEGGEALWEVVLHPTGELGGGGGIELDDFLQAALGGGAVGAVEDAADGPGDLGALVEPGDVSLSVLLEMELAALPADAREDGVANGAESSVVIADDETDAGETALQEALEEGAPVDLGLAEGGADAQDGAFACGIDAEGDEDGAISRGRRGPGGRGTRWGRGGCRGFWV